MSEKVLGFKQKDAEFFPYEKAIKIYVDESKLFPVVSKHRFEREMERKNKRIKHLQKLLKAKKEAGK